jgi:iron complex transport system permease protein
MSIFCGAALSTGGVGMQGILRNPLVSPYTLGVSSAAAFGASLAIVIFSAELIIPMAFLFSLLAVSFVLVLANIKGLKSESLILAGIAVMYAFSSGVSLLQYMATKDQLAQIVFWLMGSLSSTTWHQVGIVSLVFVLVYPVLFRLSWHLNILSSGADAARSMGTHPERVMTLMIVTVTLMTAVIVSYTGVIGFVGLAAPHIARLVFGSEHRVLFPAAALTGAGILLFSDTVARTLLGNTEIPIGIISSLIGVPFLISILVNKQRNRFS